MKEILFSADHEQKVRYKSLAISPEVIQALCTEGSRRDIECVKGLPEGARWVYSYIDDLQMVRLVFEHESFEETSIHTPPPYLEASFRAHYGNG